MVASEHVRPTNLPDLPVRDALPELLAALDDGRNAVLLAPPGAGKTTLVPLALLEADWRGDRRIILLQPRRIAARAAAHRMAALLGSKVGEEVGYRVRFESRVSERTRIEVVTEGVFTRILANDPGLEDVAAVIFDEFHERSLDTDLALALCLDLQAGLRDDLRLLAMSATMDGTEVARLLDGPVVESDGRMFPVAVEYRERPANLPIEQAMVQAVQSALSDEQSGSILCFLPGRKEIERVYERLVDSLPAMVTCHRLYGAIAPREQEEALKPAVQGSRKVIFASAIAETSVTIDGVRTVIDSGLAREPVYHPGTGLTRLETRRASLASVDQRAGRAGRTAPGKAIRLWREQQMQSLPKRPVPEIANADLASLMLDLADWGVMDPETLNWLDIPPASTVAEARSMLNDLGALDKTGLTAHGRAIHALPLPPQLAHMVVRAASFGEAEKAARLALLLQERGVGGTAIDLDARLSRLGSEQSTRAKQVRNHAKRIANKAGSSAPAVNRQALTTGVLLAFAFPSRIAKQGSATDRETVRYSMANGSGAELDALDRLASEPFLVVADLAGRAGAARILAAAALSRVELDQHFSEQIAVQTDHLFDPQTKTFSSRRSTRLGAIDLEKPVPVRTDPSQFPDMLRAAIVEHSIAFLPWSEADESLRARMVFLHAQDAESWPSVNDSDLVDTLDDWLMPFVEGCGSMRDLGHDKLSTALLMRAGMGRQRELDKLAPTHWEAPSGLFVQLRYEGADAVLAVRPQDLFGLAQHPTVFGGNVPLVIELLSPARRPIQVTRDLLGFWRGSWADVRKDLRGRYPKHDWPEDPLSARPSRGVKRKNGT